jgi:hypothetical protein
MTVTRCVIPAISPIRSGSIPSRRSRQRADAKAEILRSLLGLHQRITSSPYAASGFSQGFAWSRVLRSGLPPQGKVRAMAGRTRRLLGGRDAIKGTDLQATQRSPSQSVARASGAARCSCHMEAARRRPTQCPLWVKRNRGLIELRSALRSSRSSRRLRGLRKSRLSASSACCPEKLGT